MPLSLTYMKHESEVIELIEKYSFLINVELTLLEQRSLEKWNVQDAQEISRKLAGVITLIKSLSYFRGVEAFFTVGTPTLSADSKIGVLQIQQDFENRVKTIISFFEKHGQLLILKHILQESLIDELINSVHQPFWDKNLSRR